MSNEPGILPEPIPFGKYYLLERISVGGMAEIYKAKAFGVEGFERLLAVKKILSSIAEDESFIEMFIDEAKIAGQLNHPNIAQIFDLGKVEGSYFIALEYISGKDVKTIFERARRVGDEVNIPQVCYLVMKVCEGLAHAHNKKDSQGRDLNIVHRDVSPQNVLISYEGEVKIIDFGIAKAQGKTSQTQVGVLKGKFSYMSPEQVRGLHVDHRSDVFSLGIVLYEMLTLERLFLGESDFDTLEKIRKVEMSPPSLYNPNIPKELEDIVLKALAQNPDERFQSASAFAHALERFMRNQDYYYKNTDLAEFMKNAFKEDIEFEQKKLEYYKSLDLKPPDQLREEGAGGDDEPGLVWDEEEMETQIFDRSHRDEEFGESSAPGSRPSALSERSGGSQAGARSSGPMDAVEVVGPDDEVEIVGPDEDVDNPSEQDVAPTVEYDRWSVQDELEDMGALEEEPPAEERPNRGKEPTAQVSSGEFQAAGPMNDGPAIGSGASGGSDAKRMLIIGGSAVAFVAAALTLVFGITGGWFDSSAHIKFTTTPQSVQILINGDKVHDGPTPFSYDAKPGPTDIVIRKDGYKPDKRSRELESGTTYRLKAELMKGEAGTGEVFVKSTPPGATVKVDGEPVEDPTPVTVDELPSGKHQIIVSKEGFLEEEQEVEIEKGSSEELEIELRPETVALNIKSDPDGSRYTVYDKESGDEVTTGRTPETVDELDAEKTYRIVVDKADHEAWEDLFEPGTEKESSVMAELERDDEPTPTRTPTVAVKDDDPGSGSSGSSSSGSGSSSSGSGSTGSSGSGSSSGSSGSGSSGSSSDPPEPQGTGVLNIASKPAARVSIDGKDIGRHTPVLNYEISAGKHKISLTNKKFGLDKTYYVDLKPGETKKIINRSK